MPDAQGNYLGDRSGVLPSNTAAMLHFSDQFAQMAAQRRREQAMQQREDEARRIALQKYLGTSLNNPEFNTHTDAQGVINTDLQDLKNKATLMAQSGVPTSDVMGFINDGVTGTLQKARSINDINKGILAGVSTLKSYNPDLNDKALYDAAASDIYFQKDKDGNKVLRKDYSGVNPTDVGNRVLEIYKQNPELFYPAGSGDKALQGFFNKQKLIDAKEEGKYDNTGNRTTPGYEGKIPSFIGLQTDDKGNVLYDEKGKPKIDIAGSYNYKLQGEDHDYINNQGQPVKQVPMSLYNQLPGSTKAEIENEVKKQVSQAGLEPDSEYANMLRSNLAYNKLLGAAKNTYKFNTPKDESFDRKKALFSQKMQQARLNLSQHNSARADRVLSDKEKKEAASLDSTDFNSDYDELLSKKQEDNNSVVAGGDNPKINFGTPTEYVDVTNTDPTKLARITGVKRNAKGEVTAGVAPIEIGGRKYLLVTKDENGNDVLANDKQHIDRDEANLRQVKAIPPKSKATIMQRAKSAVNKVVNKIKGNNNPLGLDL